MKSLSKTLQKIMSPIARIEIFFGGLMMLTILVFILLQVLPRWTPIPTMPWVSEIAKYGLVWLTFAIIGYLIRADEHITLETIDLLIPEKFQRFVRIFANLVVFATALMFSYSIMQMMSELSPRHGTPALGIPMFWIYMVPLIGFVLTTIHSLIQAIVFTINGQAMPQDHTPHGDFPVGEQN